MPLSAYDKKLGFKRGAAAKARRSMRDQYGEEKGEAVFRGWLANREQDRSLAGKMKRARRTLRGS